MRDDLERLKQRLPLLEYLQRHHWTPRRSAAQQEFVGLCPLHRETRPSFYVNARKNLFYCHGCGRGGDLIRFVELSLQLPFRQSVQHLERELAPDPAAELLAQTAAFYRLELHRYPEAMHYLHRRGLQDPALIEELGIGYARGGNLRRRLAALGYAPDLPLATGLIDNQGRDAFRRRVIFPCREHGQTVNLYGRSIGAAFPHRLLPRPKGGLFAWETVSRFATGARVESATGARVESATGARVESAFVILVEGLFDLAVLWQAGFRNTTCAIGTHLTPTQLDRLTAPPRRPIHIVFDQDENQAGQQAARQLAQSLESVGVPVRIVHLPDGHDPMAQELKAHYSYFAAAAAAAGFTACLGQAQRL